MQTGKEAAVEKPLDSTALTGYISVVSGHARYGQPVLIFTSPRRQAPAGNGE
jgi:hypothetical protein